MDTIIEILCDILFDAGMAASTSQRLPKPLRMICCVLTSLAFAVIIAIVALVAIICIQDIHVVSILLGTLDIIMIFLLLSMISRAFAVGKRKK